MDAEMWTATGIICAVCILLVWAADRLERWWKLNHPPDDWDGMREDRSDEQDPRP